MVLEEGGDFQFGFIFTAREMIQCQIIDVEDGTFRYLNPHALVEQADPSGSVMLVIGVSSSENRGVYEPAIADDFCSCLADLHARSGLSRAPVVTGHGLQSTDSISVVSEEGFAWAEIMNVFGQGAHVQVWSQVQLRIAVMVRYHIGGANLDVRVTFPKPHIDNVLKSVDSA